jgi:membrane protease YdiL (CAAX protease family)
MSALSLRAQRLEPLVLAMAAAGALAIRVTVGGRPAGASIPAALLFSAALTTIAVAAGWRPQRPTLKSVVVGAVGALVLCGPPILAAAQGAEWGHGAASTFPSWAVVVAAVAITEEIMLRGVIHDAIARTSGAAAAISVTAVLFALMHVPLYGWTSFGLNLAVGGWLGVLRLVSGGVTAPAVAHTLADWAAWWLR